LLDSWEGEASFAAMIKRRIDRLAAPPSSGK
jgi:hypothetical protein